MRCWQRSLTATGNLPDPQSRAGWLNVPVYFLSAVARIGTEKAFNRKAREGDAKNAKQNMRDALLAAVTNGDR
jgi:hypothetical protein